MPEEVKKPGKAASSSLVSRGVAGAEVKDDSKESVKVSVPVMGEELDSFFSVKSIENITDKVALEIDDFNDIFCEANEM